MTSLFNVTQCLRKIAIRRAMVPAALVILCLFAGDASGDNVYYRYVNEQGIQVMDSSIPPEYAQKGYEVVSLSGEVIKTVAPAPDAEALAQREAEAKLREAYKRLSRRYSSLDDVVSAKQRKLDDIDTNIAIVRGNISGLKAQIRNLMSQAADVERQGREVPESLLNKLSGIRLELGLAQDLLEARLEEHEETVARFDQDMEIYAKGQGLAEQSRP